MSREQLGLRFDRVTLARVRRVAKARRMTVTAIVEYGLERALAELESDVDAAGIAPPALPAPPSLTLPNVEIAAVEPRRKTG